MQDNLNRAISEHDPHSSDDEETAVQKLTAEAQAVQTARASELIRIGNEKAGLAKRAQKAVKAIQADLTKTEIDYLKRQFATERAVRQRSASPAGHF